MPDVQALLREAVASPPQVSSVSAEKLETSSGMVLHVDIFAEDGNILPGGSWPRAWTAKSCAVIRTIWKEIMMVEFCSWIFRWLR